MSFIYVEMACHLNIDRYDKGLPMEGVRLVDIHDVELDVLYDGYAQSFERGDAIFYQRQSPPERRRYFDEELGFPDILDNPASFAYMVDDELIGFALVMANREANYHISCMCVLPEYQGRGLGKAMLNHIKNVALENGCRWLSLGTEPQMKAYHLYTKHGFEVIAEHLVEF